MMRSRTGSITAVMFCVLCSGQAVADKRVVGWVEPVLLYPQGLELDAKLDTGAQSSSLHAENIEIIEHGESGLVRFDTRDGKGHSYRMQLPLLRRVKIKRHFKDPHDRPVVMMSVCLGDLVRETPVNLVDRSRFEYRLLLGRTYLSPRLMVDSSRTGTTSPSCEKAAD